MLYIYIYIYAHKETKIFQKTIISPVFLPASRYFVAILNITLRQQTYTIHILYINEHIYRNCILLIISSIVFCAVDNNSLQFKKLKHYEGENCLPHCFHIASGVASFFFNLRGTVSSVAAKLLVNERSRPLWGGINNILSENCYK